jgi:hypothetical protein
MLTEKEAKYKWCPMARIVFVENKETGEPGYGPYNRWEESCNEDGTLPMGAFCLASDCMMWKWYDGIESKGYCGLVK